jgi:hypothetical protein
MAPNFVQTWMWQASGGVPEPAPAQEPAPRPDDGDAFAAYSAPRVDGHAPGRRAAIFAAAGMDAAETSPPVMFPAPQMPQEPAEPVERPSASPATPEGAPGQAARHAGDWRERRGLPRKKARLSPSQTTEGRRARYAQARAAALGISYDAALASIRTRPATTRAGRKA